MDKPPFITRISVISIHESIWWSLATIYDMHISWFSSVCHSYSWCEYKHLGIKLAQMKWAHRCVAWFVACKSTTCSTPGNWQIKWLDLDWPAVNAFHLTKSVLLAGQSISSHLVCYITMLPTRIIIRFKWIGSYCWIVYVMIDHWKLLTFCGAV